MAVITIDFETYYDKQYSLSKMTTEEYINDTRFEVIGMGIKVDDNPAEWHTGDAIERTLKSFDWSEHAVLAHNTLFDGAILAWRYGVKPGLWLDTLSMSRAIHGVDAGGSLKALVSRYQIGEKGDEVIHALGKRLADFSDSDLDRYGVYCRNDVDLCYGLFSILTKQFSSLEMQLIDLTIRMYTEPKLMVNDALLVERLDTIKREKSELLSALMGKLHCDTEEDVRKKLCSNKKFAEVLRSWDVEPPTKISPRTGKETFAFSKTDEGFIALTEHEDSFIQQLCAVRLGTKSTLEESRIGRFIDIGSRNRSLLPVPLRYYGAHTGRWSGLDSVNFQNLPSRDKKKKTLKNAIVPPVGHMVINSDSSQIEARILAWLAGQTDVVSQFANSEDVYSTFASKIYKMPISKANPVERFVGKTCVLGLGYGTGAQKLQHTLKTQPPGAELSIEECERIVSLYRSANFKIPDLWRSCDDALRDIMNWGGKSKEYSLGEHKCVTVCEDGIRLPNGMKLHYPKLRLEGGKPVYDSRKGTINIWGGAVTENIVQALARIVIGEQMVEVAKIYPVVLTVHDAIVIIVPESEVDQALAKVNRIMSNAPEWAPDLPVACEAKAAASYGEC